MEGGEASFYLGTFEALKHQTLPNMINNRMVHLTILALGLTCVGPAKAGLSLGNSHPSDGGPYESFGLQIIQDRTTAKFTNLGVVGTDTLTFSDPGGPFSASHVGIISGLNVNGDNDWKSVVGTGSLASVTTANLLNSNQVSFDYGLLRNGAGSLTFSTTPVPEPSGTLLSGLVLLSVIGRRRRPVEPRWKVVDRENRSP